MLLCIKHVGLKSEGGKGGTQGCSKLLRHGRKKKQWPEKDGGSVRVSVWGLFFKILSKFVLYGKREIEESGRLERRVNTEHRRDQVCQRLIQEVLIPHSPLSVIIMLIIFNATRMGFILCVGTFCLKATS